MNPFELVWCRNTDADERDERPIYRWMLWRSRIKRALGLRLHFGDFWKPVSSR